MEGDRWKKLPVRLTLQPGRRGTKRLWREFGERLVCVRYRYDTVRGRRIKTVELVIEEVKWEKRVMVDKIVSLKIRYHEQILREAVKRAGGRWDGEKKVWRLPIGEVKRLGLEERVTEGAEL